MISHQFRFRMASASLFFAICISPAFADYQIRVCQGEDQANGCPVAADAMFGCYTSVNDIARTVCAITDPNTGIPKILNYSYIPQGQHGGGKCGYDWGLITCHQ